MSRTWKDTPEFNSRKGRVAIPVTRANFRETFERPKPAPPEQTPGQILDAALKKLAKAPAEPAAARTATPAIAEPPQETKTPVAEPPPEQKEP